MKHLEQSKVVELTGDEWRLLWKAEAPKRLNSLLRRATIDPRTWQLKFSSPSAAAVAAPMLATVVDAANWRFDLETYRLWRDKGLNPEVKMVRRHTRERETGTHEPRPQVFFRAHWCNANTLTGVLFAADGEEVPLFMEGKR